MYAEFIYSRIDTVSVIIISIISVNVNLVKFLASFNVSKEGRKIRHEAVSHLYPL